MYQSDRPVSYKKICRKGVSGANLLHFLQANPVIPVAAYCQVRRGRVWKKGKTKYERGRVFFLR
jgi:hypothetical protein